MRWIHWHLVHSLPHHQSVPTSWYLFHYWHMHWNKYHRPAPFPVQGSQFPDPVRY